MLMRYNEQQRPRLLISLFILAALLPRFCSDMVHDAETESLHRSRTERDGNTAAGTGNTGSDTSGHGLAGASRIPGGHGSVRSDPGNIAVSELDERQQRRVIRHYKLLNRCSGKHVRVTSRRVDAKAQFDDIYAELRIVSQSFGSHIRIQSAPSFGFLCFNKHGRLIVKQSGRDRNCVFQELQTVDHYTEFRSAVNRDWFIGFNKRGQRLHGDSWQCINKQSSDWLPATCTHPQQQQPQQSVDRDENWPGIDEQQPSKHRVRHSRHRETSGSSSSSSSLGNRQRRLLQCRHFVKSDVKVFGAGYDVDRPSFAGERLDFRRLYGRLKESETDSDEQTGRHRRRHSGQDSGQDRGQGEAHGEPRDDLIERT